MKKNRHLLLIAILAAATGPQVGHAGPLPTVGSQLGSRPQVGHAGPLPTVGSQLGSQPSLGIPLYPTCSDHLYAGYARSAIPGTGQAASVQVNQQSGVVQSGSSFVAGWGGVDNDGSPPNLYWIQAGVTTDNTDGLIKYIEYNSPTDGYHFVPKGAASAGTIYGASVTKVAAGSWTASIGCVISRKERVAVRDEYDSV
jgi:hypothetical protein